MFSKEFHRYVFLAGTVLIAVAFPFSPFLLSLGIFIIAGNWIFEFNYKSKLKLLKERPGIILFMAIYLIHVIWLLNSKNFDYALHDLKIKLPLLILPLIYGTTNPLNRSEIKLLLHFFLASMLIATFLSIAILMELTPIVPIDNRSLSPFISHIRLALLMVFSAYILISFLICNRPLQYLPASAYLVFLVWLLFYILFFSAMTGLVIALVTAPVALIYWLNSKENPRYRQWAVSVILSLTILSLLYMGAAYLRFSHRETVVEEKLDKFTVNGNPYDHYTDNIDYENSQRVWLYVCDKELRSEWNKRSNYSYDGKDSKGQSIRPTLIRYMTSLSLRKDSADFSKLTNDDIKLIEEGFTNHIYKNKLALYPRVYQLYWEIENYLNYGNPSGHSFTQRIEYVKNAFRVIKRQFWFGTGTGDVNDEIKSQYKQDNSVIDEKWQFRTHNQFITTFLTLGFFGSVVLVVFFYLIFKWEVKNIDFIALSFLTISFLSMLNEDTLETQAGVSFFAFFFSVLIFGRKISSQ